MEKNNLKKRFEESEEFYAEMDKNRLESSRFSCATIILILFVIIFILVTIFLYFYINK